MPLTVFDILDRVARSPAGERPALTYAGEPRTYADLHRRSLRAANALQGLGVGPGDRVGMVLGNRHEWMELFFAIAAIGAECVPVKAMIGTPAVQRTLAEMDVRCLVADVIAAEILVELEELPRLVVAVGQVEPPAGVRTVRYGEALAAACTRAPEARTERGACFITHHTAGTERESLPVAHTHEGVLWNAFHQISDLGLRPTDRYLVTPSLAFGSGVHDILLALLWIGGHGVLMPSGGLTVERLVAAVEDHAITHVFLLPSLLPRVLAHRDGLQRLRSSDLRVILTGADAVPPSLVAALAQELPACRVVEGYGLAEFPTLAAFARPREARRMLGSAGVASSIATVRVLGADGVPAALGEGEILVRSPATAAGYRDRAQATERAFVDGWLRTGDIGVLDEEGLLTVRGRREDRVGPDAFAPAVEDAFHTVPGVGEAAVFAAAGAGGGSIAVVVPRRGEHLELETLQTACMQRLPAAQRPRAILLRDEALPRNADGKLVRRGLAPWAAQWLPRVPQLAGAPGEVAALRVRSAEPREVEPAPI
jgi:fatty-acyl-CoA synthase